MPASYIPNAQTALRNWANNFAALITAAPATYGLVAGDAVTIQAQVDAFDAALTLALDPATRSPTTVADKDAARASMLAVVRPYAIQIRNNVGVTDENKVALGLTIVDRTPTPIPAPSTTPVVAVSMQSPLSMTLQYYDSTTPDSKAKPFGALFLEIACEPSATPIADPDDIRVVTHATKSPFILNFDAADLGKKAYIAGRWVSRRGLVGPWSAIISPTVA